MINFKEKTFIALISILVIVLVIVTALLLFILPLKEEKPISNTIRTTMRIFNPPKGTEIVNNTEDLMKFWPYNIIFSLDLIPSYSVVDKDTLFGEYYLVKEELEGFIYKFELKSSGDNYNFSLINVSLILTLPNGDKYEYYLDNKTNLVLQHTFDSPLLLQNEGLLKMELKLNSSKEAIVWRNNTYCRRWFSEESGPLEYKTFHPYGNTTGGGFTFFNKYTGAFGVWTSSDMMQHRALLLSEQELVQSIKTLDLQFTAIQISIIAIIASILTTIFVEIIYKKYKRKKI